MTEQLTPPSPVRRSRLPGWLRPLITALIVLVLVGGCGYAWNEGLPPFGPSSEQWSGVFLTNGQAYFGHFYSAPGDYAVLREVYYVLATQLQSQDPKNPPTTQLSLQRLGGEIHGPTQQMRIAKQQILFVEELRTDSPLLQAILQSKQGAPTPAPAATPSPSR